MEVTTEKSRSQVNFDQALHPLYENGQNLFVFGQNCVFANIC
jgi:hypothetical protein